MDTTEKNSVAEIKEYAEGMLKQAMQDKARQESVYRSSSATDSERMASDAMKLYYEGKMSAYEGILEAIKWLGVFNLKPRQ